MAGGGDAVVQQYGPAENHDVMIRVRRTGQESGGDLSREVDSIVNALKAGNAGGFKLPPLGHRDRRARWSANSCGGRASWRRCWRCSAS